MERSISVVDALSVLRQKYGKEFLSISEAANELGLAYGSFRNMIMEGRSPVPTALVGKRRVVPLLGLAVLTFEALTGEKIEVTFGSLASDSAAKNKEKKKPGRRRNPEQSVSGDEVRHG